MAKGEGNAKPVPVSLYPIPHIELVNDAILNRGFDGVADYVQYLIEEDGTRNTKRFFHNLLVYIFYPFSLIALIILYSRAIENIYLFWFGGFLSSLFFYSVYIGTLKMRGIDPRTHGKRRKKKKKKSEVT